MDEEHRSQAKKCPFCKGLGWDPKSGEVLVGPHGDIVDYKFKRPCPYCNSDRHLAQPQDRLDMRSTYIYKGNRFDGTGKNLGKAEEPPEPPPLKIA